MAGILALLAFALAVLFHGFGFSPNAWLDWQGLALMGLLLLTFDLVVPGWPHIARRRAPGE